MHGRPSTINDGGMVPSEDGVGEAVNSDRKHKKRKTLEKNRSKKHELYAQKVKEKLSSVDIMPLVQLGGCLERIRLKCNCGFEFLASPAEIMRNTWPCPSCRRDRKKSRRLTNEEILLRASCKGFSIKYPDQYPNCETKIQLIHDQCGTEILYSLKELCNTSQPCHVCRKGGKNSSNTTEVCAINYAKKCGGELITWAGNATKKSTWKCDKGHQWEAPLSRIIQLESWCRKCRTHFRPNEFCATDTESKGFLKTIKKQLDGYLRRDIEKGRSFDLKLNDLMAARSSNCCYCGRPATGLDRKDNSVGHVKANCVPCCIRCNWMRGKYVSHSVMIEVGKLLREIDP